ncbi:hypothetical protein V2J09_001403 [Rumex salicifolius]
MATESDSPCHRIEIEDGGEGACNPKGYNHIFVNISMSLTHYTWLHENDAGPARNSGTLYN